jgi:hypothetical protein
MEGNTIATVRNWLKISSTEQWQNILNKENTTVLS